jgi:hypothetical protein
MSLSERYCIFCAAVGMESSDGLEELNVDHELPVVVFPFAVDSQASCRCAYRKSLGLIACAQPEYYVHPSQPTEVMLLIGRGLR